MAAAMKKAAAITATSKTAAMAMSAMIMACFNINLLITSVVGTPN